MLLERDDELSALRTLADAAAQGGSSVLLIEGPAGIGKTRLLVEARREAAGAGVHVLAARAGELEQELAFGVVRQLFEATVSEPLLEGAAGAAREVFEGPARGLAGADASFAILHALYRLSVNLAERAPVLLVVDDVQWCDEPSLRWLCYLVRRLDGPRVSLLCGSRPFDHSTRAHLIGEIARDPLAVTLRPQPLSEHASATLIGGDEPFTRACYGVTEGNPLMLVELARALRAEGVEPVAANAAAVAGIAPRAVSRAVLVRISRLRHDAAAVARATAVLGDDAALPLVAELAGLDDDAAVAAAGELVGAEVLADQRQLAFVHPLIRAAAYEDIPVHERALAHERAARLLDARHAGAGAVAAHLIHAPTRADVWVVDRLERAAVAAQRAGAPSSAITYLTRALEEPPPAERRPELLIALGSAEKLVHALIGDEHLYEAIELAQDPFSRATASLLLASSLLSTARADEAVALARRASAELPPEADVLRASFEALELSAPIFGGTDPVAPERYLAHRTLPLAPGLGPKLLAGLAAHQWAYSGGSAADCAALAAAALENGDLLRGGFVIPSITATITLAFADHEGDLWAPMLAQAYASGSMGLKSAVSTCGGYTHLLRGQLAEAEASMRDGIEELMLGDLRGEGRVEIASWLCTIALERGDLAAARRELEAVSDPGDTSQSSRLWLDSHARLLLAEDRFAEALAVAQESIKRWSEMTAIDTPARSHAALALHHLGRHEEALSFAEQELAIARQWGAPSVWSRALRVLGMIENDPERLHEAVELAAGSPARLEHAKALVAEGAALRAARRPSDARDPLRQALEIAASMGADAVAAQARHELYAAGGRPRTTALRGVDSLTPSERRVAERAAAGQTNRRIAEALFVTPKTVELHLRNAYRKLGASSRRDLNELLGEPDPRAGNGVMPA